MKDRFSELNDDKMDTHENLRTFGRSASFNDDEALADASLDHPLVSTSHTNKYGDMNTGFKSAKKLLFGKPNEDMASSSDNISPFHTSGFFAGRESHGCTTVDEEMTEEESESVLASEGATPMHRLSNLFYNQTLNNINLRVGPLSREVSWNENQNPNIINQNFNGRASAGLLGFQLKLNKANSSA